MMLAEICKTLDCIYINAKNHYDQGNYKDTEACLNEYKKLCTNFFPIGDLKIESRVLDLEKLLKSKNSD